MGSEMCIRDRIKTVQERRGILSDMQQDFEAEVRQEPQIRNQLSEIYALLKPVSYTHLRAHETF